MSSVLPAKVCYRTLLLFVWLPFLSSTALADELHSFQHNGLERTYELFRPADLMGPVPLLFVLHGGTHTSREQREIADFDSIAVREKFIVVYPNGIEKNWNDGRGIAKHRSHREQIDDVGFLVLLAQKIGESHEIDPRRIYSVGPSNGGMMSLRLACEASETFAAVGAIIAALPENLAKTCRPNRPVSVLLMGGTEDRLVRWKGGENSYFGRSLGRTISFQETLDTWRGLNRCSGSPTVEWLNDTAIRDGSRVQLTKYRQCAQGSEVSLYKIEGGGHRWPGGKPPRRPSLTNWLLGRQNNDINAAEVSWEFIKRHQRANNNSSLFAK